MKQQFNVTIAGKEYHFSRSITGPDNNTAYSITDPHNLPAGPVIFEQGKEGDWQTINNLDIVLKRRFIRVIELNESK
jgi:hypothetical protein